MDLTEQGKEVCVCVGGLLATLKRDGMLMSCSVSSHHSQMRERAHELLLAQILESNKQDNEIKTGCGFQINKHLHWKTLKSCF